MMLPKHTLIFAGASTAGAALLTLPLLQLQIFQQFLTFSLIGSAENLFLISALTLYTGLSAIYTWKKQHKLSHSITNIAFFIVAFWGFTVMGLISFALLWVIPMCLYQFGDEQLIAA